MTKHKVAVIDYFTGRVLSVITRAPIRCGGFDMYIYEGRRVPGYWSGRICCDDDMTKLYDAYITSSTFLATYKNQPTEG